MRDRPTPQRADSAVSSVGARVGASVGTEDGTATRIRFRVRIPGRSGDPAGWPEWLSDDVVDGCKRLRIERPWRHQRDAADLLWQGHSVVLGTGTASGKTLAYALPMIAATACGRTPPYASEEPADGWNAQAYRQRPHTAIYLSPTKALAHDQLRAWEALRPGWRVAGVDGDSEPAERDWAREHAVAVLTNPDFLHHTLLPDHARWAGILRSLRYVVVDEAHRYSGVFGSQVALVLRRLRRLAAHHGSDPVFAVCSATLADTVGSAAALTGLPATALTTVTADGSPRGPVDLTFVEPWRVSAEDATADLLADRVGQGRQAVAFVRSRRLAELVALRAADRLGEPVEARVAAYRSGYLASDRRRLEARLQDGTLRGVAATNALELGVDVGGLDAVIQCGYPGSRAAFWQQAGRAGRRGGKAEVVLVGRRHPVDAWVLDHPRTVLDDPVESVVLHPENPSVLGPHLLAAAQELPLRESDLAMFGVTSDAVLRRLGADGLLRRRGAEWFWTLPERAADRIGLRSTHGRGVQIVERATGRVLGSVDNAAAPLTVHPGAVYLHQGETYVVEELDDEHAEALVRRENPGYLTQPRTHGETRVLSVREERVVGHARLLFGEVENTEQVSSFLRRDLASGRVFDESPLDVAPRTTRTSAVWWRLSPDTLAGLAFAYGSRPRLDAAVHAAEHACAGLLPAFAPCAAWDLGSSSTLDAEGCTVFVHDQVEGSGFAEHAYAVAGRWLAAVHGRVRNCDCETGCPACVLSPRCGSPRGLDKTGAVHLLALLLD